MQFIAKVQIIFQIIAITAGLNRLLSSFLPRYRQTHEWTHLRIKNSNKLHLLGLKTHDDKKMRLATHFFSSFVGNLKKSCTFAFTIMYTSGADMDLTAGWNVV